MTASRWEISAQRTAESKRAAAIIGATYHCIDERDGLVVYDKAAVQKSVDLFRQTNGRKVCALEWPQIFRLISPHQKPFVTGKEITLRLHLDHGHVENLVLDGQLTALQKSRPGPGGSWIIARESFEIFLKGRQR